MRFKDVKKYIGEGNYKVNVTWDFFVEKYLNEKGLDVNPEYQRDHVWTESQETKYVEHVLRGGISGKDIYLNYPGWMIDFKGPFEVVDGKQRIKAVLRFLNNEITAFGILYKEFEDSLPLSAEFIVHINDLKTKKEVVKWYLEMNEGGTVHTAEELDNARKIYNNL